MARACTVVGGALAAIGLTLALAFVVVMTRDESYRTAALAAARNPGNVMYEAEFKGAQVQRAFELVGVVTGLLLILSGGTLAGLGVVAGRLRHLQEHLPNGGTD